MPHYDESFLVDCAKAEKKLSSYSLNAKQKFKFQRSFSATASSQSLRLALNGHGVHSPSTPNSTTGSSGHKNSLKGTKLARRARSFKDDLFEKISQMRTPTNTIGRSHSPHSPRTKHGKSNTNEEAKPPQGLDYHVRQVKNALKHFKDVISKNKLEVLPGNGTVVLELIANMYAALQSYTLNEHSSTLYSATTQVYLSLAKLIKLCDEVLLCEDEKNCASLSKENVKEVVDLVENAVQNLVNLANEKIKEKENAITFSSANSSSNTLHRPSVDIAGQRTSLPDIPLTPKERDILEKSSSNPIRASHSTESILRDSSPPPKPPLPNRSSNPPPLPPKRRSQPKQNSMANESDFQLDSSLLGTGLDHMSMRSRSPDDNSSLLSASAGSLDSAFNHSREDEELRALAMDTSFEDQFLEDDVGRLFDQKHLLRADASAARNQRISNESGFASMQSIRASMQSVSTKRSSEQSVQSHKSSIASSTDLSSIKKVEANLNEKNTIDHSTSISSIISSSNHHHQKISSFSNQTSSISSSSFDQSLSSSCVTSSNIVKQTHHHNELNKIVNETSSTIMTTAKSGSALITTSAVQQHQQQQQQLQQQQQHQETDNNKSEKIVNILSSVTKTNSLEISSDELVTKTAAGGTTDEVPPLPVKTRTKSIRKEERHVSTYDNVEETDNVFSELPTLRQHPAFVSLPSKHQSLIEPRRYNAFGDCEQPPPLPMKKKHIIAYMEICSASTRCSSEHLRHSVHTTHSTEQHFSPNRNISHSHTMNLSPIRKQLSSQTSPTSSPNLEKPPALPPKKQRINSTPTIITTPPPSPKPISQNSENDDGGGGGGGCGKGGLLSGVGNEMTTVNEEGNEVVNENENQINIDSNGYGRIRENKCASADNTNDDDEGIDVVVLRHASPNKKNESPLQSIKMENMPNLIEEIDISDYLIFKKEGEDGPDVKGGYLDALIVHATRVQKYGDNDEEEDAFSEAFITTFRTIITPLELIKKLTQRYQIFCLQVMSDQKQKAAKETFSLLVRVVCDLTASDLTPHLLTILVEFVYQLVCSGQLQMAKLLRNKIVEKVMVYKEHKFYTSNSIEEQRNIVINQPSLLDLKSIEIAEQMTLLDAELFQKIEIPEVLLFAKEQCEERSPNLNKFTEHFNKMSYWARSQILKQDDAKDREKHVIKFIKIMKHLRKINNYNSYLALLSALDSAPIRRLEWHKTITEGLKEYCALIDSSSSFRIYRQALGETSPPCIPYIGLVLQDLTFVHVGNQDYLRNGIVNFSKRWQQHNIIVNMKRFKKCAYPYKKNDKIIRFFENFENFLGEEQMWQISENIKPRGRKPAHQH